jgi:ABC-type cobalamin/Fe3+-siderophores transport system ATPase subunit
MKKFNPMDLIVLAIEMLYIYAVWINIAAAAGYGQVLLDKPTTSSLSLDNNNGTLGAIKKLMDRQLTVAASHNDTNQNNNNSKLTLKDHDLKDENNKAPKITGPFSLPFLS